MVTDVFPSASRFLPTVFIAHRVQQSHCSSSFHRVLLTHALALSATHHRVLLTYALALYASQIVRKKKSPRIYASIHSAGFELAKLTYTRLEDNLIRHGATVYIYTTPTRQTLLAPSAKHCEVFGESHEARTFLHINKGIGHARARSKRLTTMYVSTTAQCNNV